MGYAKLRKRPANGNAHSSVLKPAKKKSHAVVWVGVLLLLLVAGAVVLHYSPESEVNEYRRAIENGDAEAMSKLGRLRVNGKGKGEEMSKAGKSSGNVKHFVADEKDTEVHKNVRVRQDEGSKPSGKALDLGDYRKVSTDIRDEYNTPVDLPLLDFKKWYAVCDYRNKATQVKKDKIFYEVVNGACPAIDLTSKVRGLANYRATATTSFYWVTFPDGIPCVVREVRGYADFIQLELMVKDETTVKAVKNYYMDDVGAYTVGVMHEFDERYFSLVISKENPCCTAMSDLNKDDVVTSKNWGNLFVINTARRGDRTPVRAGGMREKGDLFDVKFAILKAVQFESAH